jgi:predicted nucleic acid-binding protein
MDVVVDASVAALALVSTGDDAATLFRRLAEASCHAPHLVDAEVGSVLRRGAANGVLTPGTAEAALRALDTLVTHRYPHGSLATVAWRLRNNLSYYDALYVALAAGLGYPLLTADARLAGAPGLPCTVELVA